MSQTTEAKTQQLPLNLDQETNKRASLIVLQSIAKFPQAHQCRFIIADILMRSFGDIPYGGKTVTIPEMASINPDGEFCASVANRIHTLFGIPYKITSNKAASFVRNYASMAVAQIHNRAVLVAGLDSVNLPDQLKSKYTAQTPFDLQDYFVHDQDFRIRVGQTLKDSADQWRRGSSEQQQWVKTVLLAEIQKKKA